MGVGGITRRNQAVYFTEPHLREDSKKGASEKPLRFLVRTEAYGAPEGFSITQYSPHAPPKTAFGVWKLFHDMVDLAPHNRTRLQRIAYKASG